MWDLTREVGVNRVGGEDHLGTGLVEEGKGERVYGGIDEEEVGEDGRVRRENAWPIPEESSAVEIT